MEKRLFSPLFLMVSFRVSYDKTLQNICLIQKVDSKWLYGYSCNRNRLLFLQECQSVRLSSFIKRIKDKHTVW